MRIRGTWLVAAAAFDAALFCAPNSAEAQSAMPASAPSAGAAISGFGVRATAPDGLFGSSVLPARLARFDDEWTHARQSAAADPALQRLIAPARSLSREQQLAFVQAAVDRHIRWMSSATKWGAHDYWASASETLQRGAGDATDRTILKMQALLALGFNPGDVYMTLGRDPVGGPTTLLVVRLAPASFMSLDDLGGPPLPASHRQGFQPVLSFSTTGSWLHGYRIAARGQGTATGR